MSLTNKKILVTGATSGIGKSLVLKLADLDLELAICGRSRTKMNDLLALPELKGKVSVQDTFDATDFEQVKTFVSKTTERLGQIDVLVNCAGANASRGNVADIPLEDMQNMININLLSPFVFMQEVFNLSMRAKQVGQIINVLSTVSGFSNQGIGAYTASKAGFDALTKVFRKEARDEGVKVSAIYPGGVDTPFREADRPAYLSAESVADAIVFMMSQQGNCALDELTVRPMVEKNYC